MVSAHPAVAATKPTSHRDDNRPLPQRRPLSPDTVTLEDTTRLGFADLIYGQPDGTIIIDGIVSRLGVPVAAVRFVLR